MKTIKIYILYFISILIILLSIYFKDNIYKKKPKKNKKRITNKYKKLYLEYNLPIIKSNNISTKIFYYEKLIKKYCTKKDLEFKIKPLISIVIPLYNNKKEYILRSLLSIEAQTLKNIEIIYIDDFSTNNSTDLLKILKIIDKRISLIKNDRNRGILYSKSLGVKISRSKYVIVSDQDDIFLSKKLFNTIYKKMEKYNLDILQYKRLTLNNNKILFVSDKFYPNYDTLILQPHLGKTINFLNNSLSFTFTLWDKIIKKQIYLKALKFLGKDLYNSKIIQREDHIVTFALYKVANKYMRINIYGYLYIKHKNQATKNMKKQKNSVVYDEFTFLDFLYNNTKETKEEKTVFFNEFLKILKLNICINVKENKIKLLVQKICKLSLKDNFIKGKKKISKYCNKFKKKNQIKRKIKRKKKGLKIKKKKQNK